MFLVGYRYLVPEVSIDGPIYLLVAKKNLYFTIAKSENARGNGPKTINGKQFRMDFPAPAIKSTATDN